MKLNKIPLIKKTGDRLLYTSHSFTTTYPLEEADVVFLGIPFDSTAYSEGNQRYGPVTIKQALKRRTSYQSDLDKNPFRELKIHDAGEIEVVPGKYSETQKRIEETVKDIREINPEAFMVFLGGEHLITLGTTHSLQPKTVVQLDAHKDMDKDLNGNELTHNTWARRIKNDVELLQVGTREYTEEEAEIQVEDLSSLEDMPEPIYLTVDMDVFDSEHAPDVGYPEPNGMTPSEVDEVLERVFEKDVIGMDVCEVASKEINNRTSYLAGWVILRALSRI